MTDLELKAKIKEAYLPMIDSLVEQTLTVFKAINDNLSGVPKDMQDEIINTVLKSHQDVLKNSINSMIPEDFADKLKGAMNGRKL